MTPKKSYSFVATQTHLEDMDFVSIFTVTHKFTYVLNPANVVKQPCYTN
jgi:hypothetical protein